MSGARGVFVVGTDTGVGKTTFAIGLVAALVGRGLRVAAMKPCETGDGDDAARLVAATGRALDPALACPYRFELPAAPEVAARRQGAIIDLDRLDSAFQTLASDADFTVVEGAGGLLVPLTAEATYAELVKRLALPVVLVARTQLGTINHTLLTAEVARHRGLEVLGVVFSRTVRHVGPEEDETVETIVQHGGLRSFGVLPFLSATTRKDAQRLAIAVGDHLALDALLGEVTD
jgi:dethiobiotin synthetase